MRRLVARCLYPIRCTAAALLAAMPVAHGRRRYRQPSNRSAPRLSWRGALGDTLHRLWRRRVSNPRPNKEPESFLHV